MAYTLADAAAAARRRREKGWKPGDPLEFAPVVIPKLTGTAPTQAAPAAAPPAMGAIYRPAEETGEEPGAGEPAPTGEQPPAKKKFFTKERLLSALQGAAAGIQADVGPATAGHGFGQGIMKGIVGAGTLASARAKAEEEAAGRQQTLTDKLKLLEAGRETPEQAGAKAEEVAKRTQKYKLELQQQSGEVRTRIANAIKASSAGLTAWQAIQLNNMVQDQVDARFKTAYNFNPSDEELQAMITKVKAQMVSGPAVIVKPNLP